MKGIEAKVKHCGIMDSLYKAVSDHSPDPRAEIERLAKIALEEEVINRKQYDALRHRVPFQGDDWHDYRDIVSMLRASYEEIRRREQMAAAALLRNLPRYQSQQALTNLHVASLPWKAIFLECRVRGILIYNLRNSRQTIGEAVEYLTDLYKKLKENPNNGDYRFNARSYRIASDVFKRVGFVLPELPTS